MAYAASQPYITGFEYWYLAGQTPGARSAAIDLDTGQMTPAGQVVARWFAAMSADASPPPTATPTSPVPAPSATPSAAPGDPKRRRRRRHRRRVHRQPRPWARLPTCRATRCWAAVSRLTGVYPQAVRAGDLLVGAFRTQHGTTVHDDRNGAWQLATDCGVVSIWYVADARPGVTTVSLSGLPAASCAWPWPSTAASPPAVRWQQPAVRAARPRA